MMTNTDPYKMLFPQDIIAYRAMGSGSSSLIIIYMGVWFRNVWFSQVQEASFPDGALKILQ